MGSPLRTGVINSDTPSSDRRRKGIYTLANDRVIDWTIAFLNSVRRHDPDIEVFVVPFDESHKSLAGLQSKYRFEFYDDPSLPELDALGLEFCGVNPVTAHTFRKFACFWGPLESFLYIDSDVVMFDRPGDILAAAVQENADFVYADIDMEQVYVSGEFRKDMEGTRDAVGFNTGFWYSRKGLLDLDQIRGVASKALRQKSNFAVNTMEQPFFNYCIDELGIEKSPLHKIIPDAAYCHWAQRKDVAAVGDSCRVTDPSAPDYGRKIVFMHWAGIGLSGEMPHFDLFNRQRLQSEPIAAKLAWHVQHGARALHARAYRALAGNNVLRRSYRAVRSMLSTARQ